MKSLINYIRNLEDPQYDGHIHLFNHKESIVGKIPHEKYDGVKMVGFMDIEFDDIDNINIPASYRRFIHREYDKDKHILLATGITIEDISEIYYKYKGIIKGFGELKCYDEYKGNPIKFKKISFVNDVVKFSCKNGNLPVYIHWNFNNNKDVEKFESVLKKYPSAPIVLCHCGMSKKGYNDFAYSQVCRLGQMYSNLWLDISYDALDYFFNKSSQLLQLPTSRVISGTDLNCKNYGPNHKFENEYNNTVEKMKIIQRFINTSNNLKRLFHIEGS